MRKILLIILITTLTCTQQAAQGQNISVEEYILTYKEIAIDKMRDYGIPASITIAQGILESGSGNSELARKANNHFGIKCHKGWTGKTYRVDDDKKNECFRKYPKVDDSYRDHSIFLTTRDRYAGLFELDIMDYEAWAFGLKRAGYATNPRYPDLLIKIIKENRLYDLDQEAMGGGEFLAANDRKTGLIEQSTPVAGVVTTSVINFNDFESVGTSSNDRPIYENNKVKFIFAANTDDCEQLAREFGIYSWQIRKYNDLKKKQQLVEGEIIYLEPLRKKAAKKYRHHVVMEGESVEDISRMYAVKENQLYKMNELKKGTMPVPGTKLKLR